MKIVILDGAALNPGDLSWAGFEALGQVVLYERTPAELTVARIGDAQAVITNKTILDEAVFAACPGIRYVGVLATGYNIVDAQAASRRGIPVTNIPAYGTMAVAQHVFALLLHGTNHVALHDAAVKAGRWCAQTDFCFWDAPLTELAGKTMGLVGFGRIARATASIALAFGMRVLACNTGRPAQMDGVELLSLDRVLREADVVSLHCPLTADNRGFMNRDVFQKMKDGAVLINTARGPLVNERDLVDALHGGKLSFAALNVIETEPMQANSPLLSCKNLIVTPHIAWAAKEARARLLGTAVDNLRAFLDGAPVNVVN